MIGNKMRVSQFKSDHSQDPQAFIESEILRSKNTVEQFRTALVAFPIIITICALLLIFIDKPIWRASSITTIAMIALLMFIDSNAKERIEDYQKRLTSMTNDR